MYDEEFEIGDNVIVIGFFDYEIIDEDDLIYQYAYEYDRASLYVYYIHKK